MNSIVKIALQRPLTFVVMAILILLGGTAAALRMPVDIFPEIRVPVIVVAWNFSGLSPEELAGRIVASYERALTTTVDNIEHIESRSMNGVGIVKIFFQAGVDIRTANAQVTAISQQNVRSMPAGTTPPLILNYSAATVPILQLALSGAGLSEQQLYDLGQNGIRPQLVTVKGASTPFPSGGRQRQIQIDLDPQALQSKGMSAQDVGTALVAQNQINPAGFIKIGDFQYSVKLNNAPGTIEELNNLPVKVVDNATIFMRDVAHVRDGSAPQTSVVHVDGQRSALMTIYKNGAASTLAVVDGIRDLLPKIADSLPPTLKVVPLGDQSVFVRAAVSGVVKEGIIAAALTSLMILLFLGSWRSMAIIVVSIPLSILAAIAAMSAFGQTFNIMTLGGLALAVGILVDDATVTIENINWHLEQGEEVVPAILKGAAQIVTPAFVSLLCICIVFLPMFFLPGVAGYLFVPLALAVVFAMIASFLLSRTLVPTMAAWLLKAHPPGHVTADVPLSRNPLVRFHRGFDLRFQQFREAYAGVLQRALAGRVRFVAGFMAIVMLSFLLLPLLGRNFFPAVDAGQITIHVRGPIGTRIEKTSAQFDLIQREIRRFIPAEDLVSIVDTIGLPVSSLNAAYNNTGTIGAQDGDILIALSEDHAPTDTYVAKLRETLALRFPGLSFAFLPSDMTSQILNFGAPAPIDIQISGRKAEDNAKFAAQVLRRVRTIPGLADARMQQSSRFPQLNIDVDRTRIGEYGLTERDVTNSLASSLAGTSQTAPTYFQAPEHRMASLDALQNLPVTGSGAATGQVLGALGTIERSTVAAVVSRYNLSPVVDIYATTAGRDLGAVAGDISRVLDELAPQRPKGVIATLRGQYETMQASFSGLALGLAAAVLLIYLLIVVNFQSWIDPLVIVAALPAALAGIVWMLFVTGTTLSVPALTGAIMCMGVATANSVLVVTFARERLALGDGAVTAAFTAALGRLRPVMMTALAMIIGMAPMALGKDEGGEQNAPLGRAVIGGLIAATAATLMLVPVLFSIAHRRRAPAPAPEGMRLAHG